MRVECAVCPRRMGVGLARPASPDREEMAALKLLAETCPRHRLNGRASCDTAQRYAKLKGILPAHEDEAEAAL